MTGKKRPSNYEKVAPWVNADPTKKVGLNFPIPEPLQMQLDYLVENHVIRSKSSFIREVVSAAAEEEIKKLWRIQSYMKRMEEGEQAEERAAEPSYSNDEER